MAPFQVEFPNFVDSAGLPAGSVASTEVSCCGLQFPAGQQAAPDPALWSSRCLRYSDGLGSFGNWAPHPADRSSASSGSAAGSASGQCWVESDAGRSRASSGYHRSKRWGRVGRSFLRVADCQGGSIFRGPSRGRAWCGKLWNLLSYCCSLACGVQRSWHCLLRGRSFPYFVFMAPLL